jgi:RND family efflux transporter MFP subunit
MKKIFPLLALGLVLLLGCKEGNTPSQLRRPVVTGVTLASISPILTETFYQTSGTVKARTTSVVAARTMGAVTAMKFEEGDRVKAGQVLMTIEDRDLIQKTAEAEAAYQEALMAMAGAGQNRSLAAVTFQRYKNLYQEKVISQQEMDQIETQKKVADADYERLQQTVKRARATWEASKIVLGYALVRAPVSGIVTEKRIDQGSLAAPGLPLAVIEDTSQYRVEAYIDEQYAGSFQIGTRAFVTPEKTGARIPGAIEEIVSAVDPTTRTFLVKIGVKGRTLKSGLYCRVFIPMGQKERLLVPPGAVVERGQLEGVFVVDGRGVMTYRLIRTGKIYEGGKEVLSGLKSGEKIVVGGTDRAIDGGMVKQ